MRVLLIDDEENLLIVLADQLTAEGCEVVTATDSSEGLELVSEIVPDVIVTDLRMQGMDGIAVTKELKVKAPDIPVVVLTAYAEVSTAVEAIKAGAVDYLTKPVEPSDLMFTLRRAVSESKRQRENLYLKNEVSSRLGFLEYIGESDEALEVQDMIKRAADSVAPVLISGESGAGKELVARLIHSSSSRQTRPFVTVNCREHSGAFLLQELFGRSEKQHSIVKGKLEIADGGSILLDEVTSLPSDVQGQLVRVIETGIVEPGGGRRPFRVDVRFFSSSSQDLQEAVADGKLLSDLYHRLNVLFVSLPSLAKRRDDIPLLVQYFIDKTAHHSAQIPNSISDDALAALSQYEWPGNVRELANVIEQALVMSIDGKIKVSDLPVEFIESTKSGQRSSRFIGLREKLLAEEKRLIMRALEKNSYIQRRAAKSLGISRSLLNQKIKRLKIEILRL